MNFDIRLQDLRYISLRKHGMVFVGVGFCCAVIEVSGKVDANSGYAIFEKL